MSTIWKLPTKRLTLPFWGRTTYEPFGLVGVESVLCGTRLLFDENSGCLDVIKPATVISFSVWNQDSISAAILRATAAAHVGNHHLEFTDGALLYDHSPESHARTLLQSVGVCASG